MTDAAVQWGTVGEWASAIGALAVIAVTLFLWRHEVNESRRHEERRVAQSVNAWLQNDDRFYLVASNTSDEPIYEWSARAQWQRTGAPLPGPHTETRTIDATNFGPLHPGRSVKDGVAHPLFDKLADVTVSIEFTDPHGVRWVRQGGTLKHRN